ncbi:MAG TPA: hypothetical protein VKU02_05890 [Gemmataceae bacterium]|nr:hypothetical protein [Gemmataceae bacterium]
MFRLRLATVVVAVGLGLVSGCVSLSQFPLLDRFRARMSGGCCDSGAVPDTEGPIMEGPIPNGAVPGGPAIAPVPSTAPQNVLPLNPPPRIAPQPLAQPGPYTP